MSNKYLNTNSFLVEEFNTQNEIDPHYRMLFNIDFDMILDLPLAKAYSYLEEKLTEEIKKSAREIVKNRESNKMRITLHEVNNVLTLEDVEDILSIFNLASAAILRGLVQEKRDKVGVSRLLEIEDMNFEGEAINILREHSFVCEQINIEYISKAIHVKGVN